MRKAGADAREEKVKRETAAVKLMQEGATRAGEEAPEEDWGVRNMDIHDAAQNQRDSPHPRPVTGQSAATLRARAQVARPLFAL